MMLVDSSGLEHSNEYNGLDRLLVVNDKFLESLDLIWARPKPT